MDINIKRYTEPNVDEWGEIFNGEMTYNVIATTLFNKKSVIVGWTDQLGTHFDILFTINTPRIGNIQGGLNQGNLLFVSIIRHGSFGFDIDRQEDLFPSYVHEKLFIGSAPTANKLTELINGIFKDFKERYALPINNVN